MLRGFEPTLRHLAVADQAHAAYQQAQRAGERRRDEYDRLLDDLKSRGMTGDDLEQVKWLVGTARRFDVEFSPAIALTGEMGPAMGYDVDGMAAEAGSLRDMIAEGLRHAANWTPDTI